MRQQRYLAAVLAVLALTARLAVADAWDPPAGYYDSATGSGATLKQQLHDIIDGHTVLSYDSARTNLQVTDADTNAPGHMLLVYNRVSLDVGAINPGGPIPGWDFGASWDREHTWPRSRGISDSGPDNSDLFNLRPSTPSVNSQRGNLNFGGAYGAQPFGTVSDSGATMWYPGDADAGMIARQQFYMAVRYDGFESNTTNLELGAGNVPDAGGNLDPPPQLGNLDRLIEWHFAAPPDEFERRRNQVIYDDFQHNRNPFTDRPEFVWSVFKDQANDSQISIAGATVGDDGGSTRNVDLGRVYVGGAAPSAQHFTLNKGGSAGTYYSVTTAGAATSSVTGRYNAFSMGGADSESIEIGLDTDTLTSGLRSGSVTIDNLDVTTGGCSGIGCGANDADDTFNVSFAVLDHPVASFSFDDEQRERVIDFGSVALGSGTQSWGSSFTNLAAFGAPAFAANLDLDGIAGVGDTSAFQVDLSPFMGLEQGDYVDFDSFFFPNAVGQFEATYTLNLSDEDLPGEQMQTLTLTLMAEVVAAGVPGDYNGDGNVNTADYLVWRRTYGLSVPAYSGADGDGDSMIGNGDYTVWSQNYGNSGSGSAGGFAAVPEPASAWLAVISAMACCVLRRKNRRTAAGVDAN